MHRFMETAILNYWITQVVLILLVTLVVSFAGRLLLDRLQRQALTSVNIWDDALITALRLPLRVLIWFLSIWIVAQLIIANLHVALWDNAGDHWRQLRTAVVIFCFIWFVLRFIRQVEQGYIQQSVSVDLTTMQALGKLARMMVVIIGVLVIVQNLGFSIAGVLAFGGVGGIALGFAAKDLLANFFGGFMIYLDRPFAVGDWIRSTEREIEGTVEEIGWRVTRIRTLDRRLLYVPNAMFTSITVENVTRMSHRRIEQILGLRYKDIAVIEVIAEKIEAMLKAHADIDQEQPLAVNLTQFSASSLDVVVYCFTPAIAMKDFWRVRQDVLLKVANIIKAGKAEIAFSTTTMHMPENISSANKDQPESEINK
ncbi:MAG: mechanosensitive ion channel family protein [Gammaproteobacteria bacterium]|nr:mechanosensitive ion channel family protein [Gammaproteobacteria bacterium]